MLTNGIAVDFVPLQPEPDATSQGGWGHVLLWLKDHPPENRIQLFFTEGLFGGGLARVPFDGILVQLDSDILGDDGFGAYVKEQFDYTVANPPAAEQRAKEVRHILSKAARFEEMTQADVSRHVLAPAVESTETWCVAGFSRVPSDFESLSGQVLVDEFMHALMTSEGRPLSPRYRQDTKPAIEFLRGIGPSIRPGHCRLSAFPGGPRSTSFAGTVDCGELTRLRPGQPSHGTSESDLDLVFRRVGTFKIASLRKRCRRTGDGRAASG